MGWFERYRPAIYVGPQICCSGQPFARSEFVIKDCATHHRRFSGHKPTAKWTRRALAQCAHIQCLLSTGPVKARPVLWSDIFTTGVFAGPGLTVLIPTAARATWSRGQGVKGNRTCTLHLFIFYKTGRPCTNHLLPAKEGSAAPSGATKRHRNQEVLSKRPIPRPRH